MTALGVPASAKQLGVLVKQGEGPALEFKRSTGELKEGMQTLCAFLNGSGGRVLFGVRPDGTINGQEVSDQTLRDVAQASDRFEPPAHVSIRRIKVTAGIAQPVFQESGPFAVVTFPVRVGQTPQVGAQDEAQVGTKLGLSQDQVEILRLCRRERTLVELMNAIGRRNRTKFRDSFIKPLLEKGFLALTIPDKPQSRLQRYRTTAHGLAVLKDVKGDRKGEPK